MLPSSNSYKRGAGVALNTDLPFDVLKTIGRRIDLSEPDKSKFRDWLNATDPIAQLFEVYQKLAEMLEDDESLVAVYAQNNPKEFSVNFPADRDMTISVTVTVGDARVVVGIPTPVQLASVEIKSHRKYPGEYTFFGFRALPLDKLREMARDGSGNELGLKCWDGSLFQRPRYEEWEKWRIEIQGRLDGTIMGRDAFD